MQIIRAIVLIACACLVWGATAQSDEDVQKYLQIASKVENIKLKSLRDELSILRQEKRRASKIEDARSRRDAIEKIQAKEKLIRLEMQIIRGAGYFPSIFYEGLEVGALGTITGDPFFQTTIHRIRVFQIIDEKTMIVELNLRTRTDDIFHPSVSSKKLVYVNEFPTGKLTDKTILASLRIGKAVPDTIWYVSGNKTYETLNGGSNTILSIKPVPTEQIEKIKEASKRGE